MLTLLLFLDVCLQPLELWMGGCKSELSPMPTNHENCIFCGILITGYCSYSNTNWNNEGWGTCHELSLVFGRLVLLSRCSYTISARECQALLACFHTPRAAALPVHVNSERFFQCSLEMSSWEWNAPYKCYRDFYLIILSQSASVYFALDALRFYLLYF